ncbi:MAG: acyl-[acyl-carrier-protein]--UDP-N-acetylglucosamine O-acyltransferase [Desulfobulbus propionicus]|nr:MAG: acyl-[acyl-carrier-protein]--UDP-N-acetylglucosamine O-acyltransferase [Desulfobulbus propionicus]
MNIHATAVVDDNARLGDNVEVGPYTIIHAGAVIGAGSTIESHCVIHGGTTIGEGNKIASFCSIGAPPQDIHYRGEPTQLEIGNDNVIREYVSINRGTVKGGGLTSLGDHNLIMAYCHVAHDCRIASNVIMANVATLAGHVEIGNNANLGGLVAVHQFCRIGDYAYVGGMSGISLDVPPYVILEGTRNQMRIAGINKIGLRRSGMDRETIKLLDQAFKLLFRSPDLLLKDSLAMLGEGEFLQCREVQLIVEFFNSSKRGVVKRTMED